MFRQKGQGLFSGLWKPKNPHSLEHLKYLYSVLSKNQTVTDNNRSLLVETLRSIAEILIWGDQNDSSVFDFFLERNMLSFFLKIMNQKCGSYVCVQLLQTLNILFENIRNETSIYYLLSNNHVNAIIVHKFDFSDEEVMAYYISFLKTLSFRLNKHTIHFFYNEHTNDFPLYTEAIKFFNHSESMVRIAVRTLTLNVYRTEEESMLQFVIDKTAVPYFSNLVWFIGNHILDMDACVRNDADHRSLNRLKDLVAEHLDHLHYLNDILCLQIKPLNAVLTDHLLNRLFIPLYIFSIGRPGAGLGGQGGQATSSLEDMKPHVGRVTALFLLCQVFLIITHVPLVQVLAWIIFAGDQQIFTEKGAAKISLYSSKQLMKPSFSAPVQPLEKSLREQIATASSSTSLSSRNEQLRPGGAGGVGGAGGAGQPADAQQPDAADVDPQALSITDEQKELMLQLGQGAASLPVGIEAGAGTGPAGEFSLEGRPFLDALFQALGCQDNDYLALFAICLIYAMQQNSGIGAPLLESVCIPSPRSEHKEMYNIPLMERLLRLLYSSCHYTSRIRLVTLDIGIKLFKSLVLRPVAGSALADAHLAELEGVREECTLVLRNYYQSEEIFLDMFEDELSESSKRDTRLDYVMSDASLLLPPTGTPLTGIDFTKRLPCGDVERVRKSIRTFFRLRQLSLEVQGLEETKLPLSSPDSCVHVQDVLDLNNSDLLAVTVLNRGCVAPGDVPSSSSSSSSKPQHRFLVVDVYQIVLVEPDSTRLGWGVATFAGFLQDLEVVTDKDDSRCLHVTVHSRGSASAASSSAALMARGAAQGGRRPAASSSAPGSKRMPLLSATFTFDDHIRCMAAKQRLTKGRTKARQRKMHQIARLLELPSSVGPNCPSPPTVNLHSLRKEAAAQRRGRATSGGGVPSIRVAGGGSGATGAYRPMFSMAGKVPGAAALLRDQATTSPSPGHSPSHGHAYLTESSGGESAPSTPAPTGAAAAAARHSGSSSEAESCDQPGDGPRIAAGHRMGPASAARLKLNKLPKKLAEPATATAATDDEDFFDPEPAATPKKETETTF